jgi:hypothetical protein
VLYTFITARTGGWAEDDAIPGVIRPLFAWAKTPPGTGIFALALIVLMFIAPRGIVGFFKQHSPRIVRVIPKPAGTGAVTGATIAADIAVDDEAMLTNTKGETT